MSTQTPMSVEGWEFEFTKEMLELLRDSKAASPAIILYVEDNRKAGRPPFAGRWDVRSTLQTGAAEYAIVLSAENVDLRGDLYDLAEALNQSEDRWPRTEATEGVATPTAVIGRL